MAAICSVITTATSAAAGRKTTSEWSQSSNPAADFDSTNRTNTRRFVRLCLYSWGMAKLTAAYTWTPEEELALWKEARVYASQNKSYAIRGKTYTRQDLDMINRQIDSLTNQISATSGKLRVAIGRHARRV
jgi:hypothetical protein